MPDYKKMRAGVLSSELKSPEDCDEVRAFFLEATDPQTDLHTHYRAYGWPIEKELMTGIGAFDQEYPLAAHDMRLLRRFLLKRYSFRNVFKLDKTLRKHGAGFWWLAKDYVLPRIGLSLLVGFGLTLGASRLFDGLGELAANGCLAVALILVCVMLTMFLVYLNVRDTLGAGDSAIKKRTFGIFIAAVLWTGLELLIVFLMSLVMRHDPRFVASWCFNWLHAAETGAMALAFAILTQFFFTKAGSMAEPL